MERASFAKRTRDPSFESGYGFTHDFDVADYRILTQIVLFKCFESLHWPKIAGCSINRLRDVS